MAANRWDDWDDDYPMDETPEAATGANNRWDRIKVATPWGTLFALTGLVLIGTVGNNSDLSMIGVIVLIGLRQVWRTFATREPPPDGRFFALATWVFADRFRPAEVPRAISGAKDYFDQVDARTAWYQADKRRSSTLTQISGVSTCAAIWILWDGNTVGYLLVTAFCISAMLELFGR